MPLLRIQNPQLKELFKTPKRKTYTLAGVTALTVGLFIFFSLRPTFIKIAHLNREIKDKEDLLEKLDDKLEALNYLITQKQSITQELTYFEKDFPTEEKSGFLVANFAAIAEKYDLDLMSVVFEEIESEDVVMEVENAERVAIIEGSIRLEGDFSNIESYVNHLESFPRIFDVQTVNYSKTDVTQFRGELQDFRPVECSITMHIYHWIGESVTEES